MIALIEPISRTRPQAAAKAVPLRRAPAAPHRPAARTSCASAKLASRTRGIHQERLRPDPKSLTTGPEPHHLHQAPCSMVAPTTCAATVGADEREVDYEAERRRRHRRGRPRDCRRRCLGTCGSHGHNDVTRRTCSQAQAVAARKSIDTFCPIGPWPFTATNRSREHRHLVLGQRRVAPDANTRDMIFDIPAIIRRSRRA